MRLSKTLLASTLLMLGATAGAQSLVTDLPAVYITTPQGADQINTETYILTNMTIVEKDGTVTQYADTKVRGRGSAKFALEKKPYKLKLFAKARLLGTGKGNGKKWNLMAQHGDKSLLRNAVGSFIALETGQPFAPGVKFVDLVIDGEYQGTYQLTDQVDIRKYRVNITEQPEVIDATTNITGGYLLEIDDSAEDTESSTVFTTTRGMKVTIKSPDEDVIVSQQTDYIAAHVQKFEDALFADNWLDANNGYRKYMDLTSFVQWYITAEYTAEPNSFRSVYFYKDIDNDKLTFGPVWDFDFAFDNSERWGARPHALVAQEGRGAEWCYLWIDRLRQDPEFHKAVNEAWKALIANGIVEKVNAYIDEQAALLAQSAAKNFELYPIEVKVHDERVLFSSYAENIAFLKQTQAARAEFLTEAFQTLADGGSVPETGESSIEEITKPSNEADMIFDLQGRRLSAPIKGLNIINGKKVWVK